MVEMECMDLHVGLEALALGYLTFEHAPIPVSSERVEYAFKRCCMELLPEQLEALSIDRNAVIHEAAMNHVPFRGRVRRNLLARCLLAALICRISGYRGALVGWERDDDGATLSPPSHWWQVQPDDERVARTFYRLSVPGVT